MTWADVGIVLFLIFALPLLIVAFLLFMWWYLDHTVGWLLDKWWK